MKPQLAQPGVAAQFQLIEVSPLAKDVMTHLQRFSTYLLGITITKSWDRHGGLCPQTIQAILDS